MMMMMDDELLLLVFNVHIQSNMAFTTSGSRVVSIRIYVFRLLVEPNQVVIKLNI